MDPSRTPALLIDAPRMQRNIQRMQSRMDALGVHFRPHVKTSKCIEVARRQAAAGARGITVSTVKEAEVFFAAGFDDILYAVGLAPNKVGPVLDLQQRGCRIQVIVDSIAAADALLAESQRRGLTPHVLIEIDTDGHRSGVLPESGLLLTLGERLHAAGALHGVMTHAGSSYHQHTPEGLRAVAEQERSGCVRAAERLRSAGAACAVVSVGSTPTALSAEHLAGVTEVRAGVYVFFDLVMAGVGVCTPEDIALSVLTTVIGHQRDRGWVLVDAGWMAMSRDRGTHQQAEDQGYGLVCDESGHLLTGWIMDGANQEHGILACKRAGLAGVDDAAIESVFPVGRRLRILPNHACATAAQHEAYTVLAGGNGGSPASEHWARFGGW